MNIYSNVRLDLHLAVAWTLMGCLNEVTEAAERLRGALAWMYVTQALPAASKPNWPHGQEEIGTRSH